MSESFPRTPAIALGRDADGEKFVRWTLLSPEHGLMTAMQRHSRKGGAGVDLFDMADWQFDPRKSASGPWFVREAILIFRPEGISASFERLTWASRAARAVQMNAAHIDDPRPVCRLLVRALAAIGDKPDPATAYLKFLYAYARSEGFGVETGWLGQLPAEFQGLVRTRLREPLTAVAEPGRPVADAGEAAPIGPRVIASLEQFLVDTADWRFPSAVVAGSP
jgi:hypothetical protein